MSDWGEVKRDVHDFLAGQDETAAPSRRQIKDQLESLFEAFDAGSLKGALIHAVELPDHLQRLVRDWHAADPTKTDSERGMTNE